MLSLKQCRKILGRKSKLTDQELEKLRDSMYGLADIAIQAFLEQRDRERQQAKKAKSSSAGSTAPHK